MPKIKKYTPKKHCAVPMPKSKRRRVRGRIRRK